MPKTLNRIGSGGSLRDSKFWTDAEQLKIDEIIAMLGFELSRDRRRLAAQCALSAALQALNQPKVELMLIARITECVDGLGVDHRDTVPGDEDLGDLDEALADPDSDLSRSGAIDRPGWYLVAESLDGCEWLVIDYYQEPKP